MKKEKEIKGRWKKDKFIVNSGKVLEKTSNKDIVAEIESENYQVELYEEKNRFIPHIDFTKPANFAKFGSAEKYYYDAIASVYGTYPYDGSGSGPSMSIPNTKYSASFSSSASIPITITHSLNTTDIVYSVRENNNFITANVVINDSNSVIVTTDGDITNGRINIIG